MTREGFPDPRFDLSVYVVNNDTHSACDDKRRINILCVRDDYAWLDGILPYLEIRRNFQKYLGSVLSILDFFFEFSDLQRSNYFNSFFCLNHLKMV